MQLSTNVTGSSSLSSCEMTTPTDNDEKSADTHVTPPQNEVYTVAHNFVLHKFYHTMH